MDGTSWRPDGWDATARLGILTAHAAVGAESELGAMMPSGVVVHSSRVPFRAMSPGGRMAPRISPASVRAFAEPPFVDEAAELLRAAPLDAIGFAFTASGYVIGEDGEAELVTRLSEPGGTPIITTCMAAVAALESLRVTRLAVVSPPWFGEDLVACARGYFEARGFTVVASEAADLPSEQRLIERGALFDWVVRNASDDAEGIFIGGNGFRAVGVIEALERVLERPVVTANQALLWSLLNLAGVKAEIVAYGRLFGQSAPVSAQPGRSSGVDQNEGE